MQLSASQLEQLDNDGFLIFHDVFSSQEVDSISSRLPQLFAETSESNVIERNSGVVRTSMGLHQRDELFADLVHHPRLIEPAKQILNEALYIQQVKVNVKAAFTGEIWQWHTDFATHHAEDGVPKPLALNLHILLDDVNEFNGPLYFVPSSHKIGAHAAATLDDQTTSYPLWVTDTERVREVVSRSSIVSAKGKRGTVLIFHDTLIHGSPNNMSPWDRAIFSLVVNPVSNAYTTPTRPDYKHHRDTSAIEPVCDSCLDKYSDPEADREPDNKLSADM